MDFVERRRFLITGGTGSFGKELARELIRQGNAVCIYSRDEFKQYEMGDEYPEKNIQFWIGDVRDYDRLYDVISRFQPEVIIHAAALKQVHTAEKNPLEAVKTNVMGAANLIQASIRAKVPKVIALSTDKACNPINLYGATKLCAEKMFIAAQATSTKFSIVRYGNVFGSRGSIIPYFRELAKRLQPIPITDEKMTRFWITLPSTVIFVRKCLNLMEGGEVFVPKIASMKIIDLAKAIYDKVEVVGIRPGEKINEVLISKDEAHKTLSYDGYYKIVENRYGSKDGVPCRDGWEYSSHENESWLTQKELKRLLERWEDLDE